jgi:hypothetical protein
VSGATLECVVRTACGSKWVHFFEGRDPSATADGSDNAYALAMTSAAWRSKSMSIGKAVVVREEIGDKSPHSKLSRVSGVAQSFRVTGDHPL